jgi:hypothetical protein
VSLNHQNPLRGPRYSSGVLIERAYKQGGRGGESSKVSTRMIEARCQCREKGGERERERERVVCHRVWGLNVMPAAGRLPPPFIGKGRQFQAYVAQ